MIRKSCLTILTIFAAALLANACAPIVYSSYALSDSDGKVGLSADFDDFSGLSYRLDADTSVDVNVSGGNSRAAAPSGKMLVDFYASGRAGVPVSLASNVVEIRHCAPIADGPRQIANYRSGPFGTRTETRWTLELPAVPQSCRFQLPTLRFGDKTWTSPWIGAQRKSTSRMWDAVGMPSTER